MKCDICEKNVRNFKEFRFSKQNMVVLCLKCAKKIHILQKFRPIQSAPEDGTMIFVIGNHDGSSIKYILLARYDQLNKKWVSVETGYIIKRIMYWYPVLLPYNAKEMLKGV
jgi:hypothetical protein